jgi:uncharacterized protein
MKRREFLLKGAAGVAAAGLAVPSLHAASAGKKPGGKIVYRTLGRTGLKVPVLSFGVMNTDSPELIKKALDMGINHLDTANGYLRGNSEASIGRVLKETGMRDKVYVSTKIWQARDWNTGAFTVEDTGRMPAATVENFNRMLEESLERLQFSYVDILYIHACDNAGMVTFENTMNAAVKAKEAGKTRFIGVSVHAKVAEVIRAAVDAKVYDVVEAAFNFQREDRDEIAKAVEYARENGVGIVAMKTQGGARREGDPAAFNHKASLKWVLQHKGVSTTIPGMSTFEQLELNFSVMADLSLTEEEKKAVRLTGLNHGQFCQNCNACATQCPAGVAIPDLMRAYRYAEGYGNFSHAEWTLGNLPAAHGLAACGSCSECKVDCIHGVDVASRVHKLGRQFHQYA